MREVRWRDEIDFYILDIDELLDIWEAAFRVGERDLAADLLVIINMRSGWGREVLRKEHIDDVRQRVRDILNSQPPKR